MPDAAGKIRYPPELPVTQRKDEILAAIRDHQVVVVAGETGSGKSTQLPKICLELGRGDGAMIGHTQPRRLAARAVAERVAEELGGEVGGTVGYAVRFTDRVGPATRVKVMTDGILLAEIARDRHLRRYDTVIVDEAHERSLNVDFLLGYLTRLLPRRPELKVVVTSATIDTERFSAHFGGAPVVEVSGRAYPVEVRYRPVVDDAGDLGRDQTAAVCDAVRELAAEGPGDVLVFLSGEREIRDAADALAALNLPATELLPLYARLSAAEQHRIFQAHAGRRIVLATNVAETSLTVPGIRFVVDAGTARISRYNRRTKVQRLPIEPISQASADQRAGRCGRLGPGICIRLYSEEDLRGRPAFPEPEIVRTNLASVVLQMAANRLGDVADFPFVDPPDRRAVADGVALLIELGALEQATPAPRLTPLGRRLAALPLDPRLGRMVLEADGLGCLREVMVIAAGLSIQDPRERPAEARQAADELHRRFAEPASDFLAYRNLWDHLRALQKELSSNQFRKRCRAEFVHHQRAREWQDIYSQLRHTVAGLGLRVNREPGSPDAVHRALLAGLLSHVGLRDGDRREYLGARQARFTLAPASALAGRPPPWVMAAELVETDRLRARVAAQIQPQWVERAGAHLVVRTFGEPRWDARRGAAVADERVTLYGLPLVSGRTVAYSRVDPVAARELFLRTRSWRATGSRPTGSRPTTGRWSPGYGSSRSGPGALSWSTRRPWSSSSISGSVLTSYRPATSTHGGSGSCPIGRTCSTGPSTCWWTRQPVRSGRTATPTSGATATSAWPCRTGTGPASQATGSPCTSPWRCSTSSTGTASAGTSGGFATTWWPRCCGPCPRRCDASWFPSPTSRPGSCSAPALVTGRSQWCWPARWPGPPAARHRRGRCASMCCPTTCGWRSRSRTTPASRSPPAGTSPTCEPGCSPRSAGRWPPQAGRWARPACGRGPSAPCPERSRCAGRRGRSGATRPWSTRATRWPSWRWPRPPTRRARCGPAPGGSCC